jgi:transposase
VAHHIPFKRVRAILADLLGCAVSTGWVNNCLSRIATGLTGFRDWLCGAVAGAPVVHFDETGARVGGRGRWVHVACTALLTHYHLDDLRGSGGINAHAILPRLTAPQVAVHDGWMSYFTTDYNTTDHALCNAHHLREFNKWTDADPANKHWAIPFADLLREGNNLVKQAKNDNRTHLEPDVLSDLLHRWQQALDRAYAANPPPPPKTKTKTNRAPARGSILSLIDRMRAVDEIWRFARDFTVPFDNNQAERDLRMVKLQNKISGGWRDKTRATAWLQVREYIATTAKNGLAAITALYDAVTGNPHLPVLPE